MTRRRRSTDPLRRRLETLGVTAGEIQEMTPTEYNKAAMLLWADEESESDHSDRVEKLGENDDGQVIIKLEGEIRRITQATIDGASPGVQNDE